MNEEDEKMGFASAISVEPLLAMLAINRIYPGSNRKLLEELYHE